MDNKPEKEGFLKTFAKFNKEFDSTFYLVGAFGCHTLTIVGIFAMAIFWHGNKQENVFMTPELTHSIIIGSFSILNLMGGFLFGKKSGELEAIKKMNGNGVVKPAEATT